MNRPPTAAGAGASAEGRRQLVVAVDGGGSKTDLAIVSAAGELLARVRGGPTQVHYLGPARAAEVLGALLDEAVAAAGLDAGEKPVAATAHLLIAGLDLPEEHEAFSAVMDRTVWAPRLVVGNDTDAILRSGSDRGWGVGVVCGTGINCAGIAPDGREARFLSFGDVSGDWGGGPDIGLAALAAAVRGTDGRGRRTVLQRALPEHFGLSDPLALARAFHIGGLPRARLGEVAGLVILLSADDPVAAEIVDHLSGEIVAFVGAAIDRLELTGTDPEVVLGGRVARSLPTWVVERIVAGIRAKAPRALVVVSPAEPIVGAVLLGLDLLGADQRAKSRARAELAPCDA